jgi:hypothetical protein
LSAILIKLLDGLAFGLLVTVALFTIRHVWSATYKEWTEPAHRQGLDLAAGVRINPGRYLESAIPIVVVGVDNKDVPEWWDRPNARPSETLLDVATYLGDRGALAIVIDHAVDPELIERCAPIRMASADTVERSLCHWQGAPMVFSVIVPQPTFRPPSPNFDRAESQRDTNNVCPNIWFGRVNTEGSPADDFVRTVLPWTTRPNRGAIPHISLLALRLAERERGRLAQGQPPEHVRQAAAHATAILGQGYPGARSACAGPFLANPTLSETLGEWTAATTTAVKPVGVLVEFRDDDVAYGYAPQNLSTYRVLAFSAVREAAREWRARADGGLAQFASPGPFQGAIVLIGRIGEAAAAIRDVHRTPIGAISGPVLLANEVRSLEIVGATSEPSEWAEFINEIFIAAIAATFLALGFWPMVWVWRVYVSPTLDIRAAGFPFVIVAGIYLFGWIAVLRGALWSIAALAILFIALPAAVAAATSYFFGCLELFYALRCLALVARFVGLMLRVALFLAAAIFGCVALYYVVMAAFMFIDGTVVSWWSNKILAGVLMDFFLPAIFVVMKAVVEASGLFTAGLSRQSATAVAALARRRGSSDQAVWHALRDLEHQSE